MGISARWLPLLGRSFTKRKSPRTASGPRDKFPRRLAVVRKSWGSSDLESLSGEDPEVSSKPGTIQRIDIDVPPLASGIPVGVDREDFSNTHNVPKTPLTFPQVASHQLAPIPSGSQLDNSYTSVYNVVSVVPLYVGRYTPRG